MTAASTNPTQTLRARWVVTGTTPPIENGQVVIRGGRIESAGEADRSAPAEDLGDAILLPGLVNAHTHLELSCCRGRVPHQGTFASWIRTLTGINPHREGEAAVRASIERGLEESLAAGVTTVGDIGHGGIVHSAWTRAPVNVTGYLEVIGLGAKFLQAVAADRSVDAVERVLRNAGDGHDGSAGVRAPVRMEPLRRFGITPHAPYSTDPNVYRDAMRLARARSLPLCTHLAETREEEAFLRDGSGPLRNLLEEMELWDGCFEPPACSPVMYAQRLGLLDAPVLLAHVNYVDDADLEVLAASGASVAYCPRTHRFFEHEPHRYRDMLARGINVCIGTDSLASNPSLSILDELRLLHQRDAAPADQLLAMATWRGALALGLPDDTGSIAPGKRADLTCVPLSQAGSKQPLADLLEGSEPPVRTWLAGRPTG